MAYAQTNYFHSLILKESCSKNSFNLIHNISNEQEFLFSPFLYKNNYITDEAKIRIFDSLIISTYFNGQMFRNKLEFIYNDKNKISGLFWYDDEDILFAKFNYYYDSNGFLVKFTEEYLDFFYSYFELIKQLDEKGRVLQELEREAVNQNDTLENISRITYKYDNSGNPIEYIIEKWENNNWVFYDKSLMEYSADNLIIAAFTQVWENNCWNDKAYFQYDYDSENKLRKSMYMIFTDQKWKLRSLADFQYSLYEDTNKTEILIEGFENNISVVKSRFTYKYDLSDFFISGKIETFFNNKWILDIGPISLRNPDGFEINFLATEMKAYYKKNATSIKDENFNTQKNYFLSQNYPNPFNPSTTIQYSVPSVMVSRQMTESNHDKVDVTLRLRQPTDQSDIHVTLKVYDILGREVATLVNENKPAGNYEVKFDGSNLSSGVYFYTLKAGSFSETKKMLLLK
jgi:hypothetical protein